MDHDRAAWRDARVAARALGAVAACAEHAFRDGRPSTTGVGDATTAAGACDEAARDYVLYRGVDGTGVPETASFGSLAGAQHTTAD